MIHVQDPLELTMGPVARAIRRRHILDERVLVPNLVGVRSMVTSANPDDPFASQTTGMYYTISLNGSSTPIYDGNARGDVFNVGAQEEESSGSFLLIIVLLVVVIGVLGTVVVVLSTRNKSGSMLDDEDDDDEDYISDGGKVLAEIPANVDPEMARAMETFPQWTQDEIQGYFDQGWDVESLQDWVNNQ